MLRSPKFGPRAGGRSSARRARLWKLGWERLEDLTLLSAYLYVDYGDNFAGGVLQGADVTVKNLFDRTVDGSNIHGPKLTDDQGDAFADATTFSLTSFASFYAGTGSSTTQIAQMRATINAMVERVYAPFDVTVIDLTTAGATVGGKTVAAAASLDDVARTLAASGNGFDSYVFVAQAIIGGTTAGPTTDPTQFADNGYGGKASGLDIGGDNNNQGTALSLLRADYGVNKVAQTIVHEAGHLFGLAHAWRSDGGADPDPRDSLGDYKDQLDLYHRFDTMSYLAFSGVSGFSRVPITADKVLDGGDWVPNLDPAVLNAAPTPYDHFKADPNVGINSNIEYVTGTGAHDVITIAKTGPTTALVTIAPFFDQTYETAINIPGQTTATHSYTIDTTKAIIIDGGSGRDKFIIDGDLGTTITVHGNTYSGDLSTLEILGKGAASGVYTPGTHKDPALTGGDDRRGEIVIGSTTINFLEFVNGSGVTVSDVQNFVFRTPPAPGHGSSGNALTIDGPADGQNRVGRNGSTSGVTIIPLTIFDVANFTIDTATHNADSPNDRITLDSPGLIASGLQNFTINTGDGDDALSIAAGASFGLPVPGGAFTYNAGGQTTSLGDGLTIRGLAGDEGAFHPDGASAGSGRFIKNGTTLFTNGLERAEVQGFADFALVTPNDGDDARIVPTSFGGENEIKGASGGVAFSSLTFHHVTNFLIDSRTNNPGGMLGNRYAIDNPGGRALEAAGLKNFTIRSSAGDDVLTINADDFRLPSSGGEFLFDGGTGRHADDSPASNLRGLISFDRIIVGADVDFLIKDVGPFAADGTPAEGLLSIAPAGSGDAASASLGSIRLVGVEGATLSGGPSGNRIDGSGFSGTLILNGGDGDDVLIGGSGHNELNAGGGDDVLIVGYDALASSGLGSQNQVVFRGGGTNILRGGSGRNAFHVGLNGTSTLIGGDGENLYVIVNPPDGLVDPVGGITIQGAGKPTDVLRLEGGGGNGYNQIHLLGPAPGSGNIVTTNNHVPDGPTISQFIRYNGVARIEDSIAAGEMIVLGESTTAPIGGISGDDLAAGALNPTVGGLPFGEIAFSNKSAPMVQLADGRLVTLPPPSPPPAPAPAPAPLVAAPTPAPGPPIAVATRVAPALAPVPTPAPIVVEAPIIPAPIVESPARPGLVRPLARRLPAGRLLPARPIPRPIAARPSPARRVALAPARPPTKLPVLRPRPAAFALRGPLGLARWA